MAAPTNKINYQVLRAILYTAAGSSMRFNPIIKAYTDRLPTAKGKTYKVACCAAVRKLVHIAFAVVKLAKVLARFILAHLIRKRIKFS